MLSNIISKEQFAFIKGRNIFESVLIVKELVHHSLGRGDVEGRIFKIDFKKKTSKLVKWSYLFQVLKILDLERNDEYGSSRSLNYFFDRI